MGGRSSIGTRIYWAGDHTNAVACGAPLPVMDMYDHAFAIDHGASAKDYIDAFFKDIQWAEVEARLARARKRATRRCVADRHPICAAAFVRALATLPISKAGFVAAGAAHDRTRTT